MTCYHPLIRIQQAGVWKTAKDGHQYPYGKIQKLGNWNVKDIRKCIDNENTLYDIIPCGHCIGCRLDYSREWANRGYLESKCWEQNWFVTLTYDEDHLIIPNEIEIPVEKTSLTRKIKKKDDWKGTLVPDHLKQFIKNLRQIMAREEIQASGIRFMACGEYGEERKRPHYHIILFNCNLPPDTFYNPRIINKNTYWQNKIIERAWGTKKVNDKLVKEYKGICNISEATWNDIAYTARYITKKINGDGSLDQYAENGQIKEFFRVSRMPGIGEPYFREHYKEIYERDEIIVKNASGVVSCTPPSYFDDLYEQIDPIHLREIKKQRREQALNNELNKREKTSQDPLSQLEIEERQKQSKTLQLAREFERKALT